MSSEINILTETNALLNNRRELQTEYQTLKNELKILEANEAQRREQLNHERKNELIALEQLGEKLCKEHAKLMHQIEHINWHISRAHPHDISTPIEHPPAFPKSCHSAAMVGGGGHNHGKSHCSGKPLANMVIFHINIYYLSFMHLRFCRNKF